MDHAHQHLMRSGSSRFYMRSLTHSVIAHRLHYSRRRTLCSNDTRSYLECLLASQKDREEDEEEINKGAEYLYLYVRVDMTSVLLYRQLSICTSAICEGLPRM